MGSKIRVQSLPRPEEDGAHAFVDSSHRFAVDTLLRHHGFRIATRPPGGSAIWEREGEEYLERDALATLNRVDVQDARMLQEMYWDTYE